jgi:hypothetical protein
MFNIEYYIYFIQNAYLLNINKLFKYIYWIWIQDIFNNNSYQTIMLVRCCDGKLIDIKIQNFICDNEYYEVILKAHTWSK